jgi:prepilin-type N-terminal cleavage/methylation domain-containing protein
LKTKRRDGFTLAEVLVTIAIIAVIAAVMLPVVSGQLRKGDLGRVQNDLVGLRTSMEAFLSDVRRVPSEIQHLITAPTANSSAADSDINGDEFPTGLVARWKGPYIDKELQSGSIATGFGGTMANTLTKVAGPGSVDWATVTLNNLTDEEFDDLDEVLDNDDGSTAGRFRWTTTTATFFLIPVN